MAAFVTADEVLEALANGSYAGEIQPSLDRLPATDRQAVLCTACFMIEEVSSNCQEWADEISEVITLNCSLYKAGIRTCGFSLQQISSAPDFANDSEP
jgi:hypothetical protein